MHVNYVIQLRVCTLSSVYDYLHNGEHQLIRCAPATNDVRLISQITSVSGSKYLVDIKRAAVLLVIFRNERDRRPFEVDDDGH